MSPRSFLPALVSVGVIAFLLGAFLSSPATATRAFAPNARATPTVSKRMNARFLENHRSTDFVQRNADGVAKAGLRAQCSSHPVNDTFIIYSFNNVNKTPSAISKVDDTVYGGGSCKIDFGFPIEDRYVIATSEFMPEQGLQHQAVILERSGNSIIIDGGGGGASLITVIVY